MILRTSDVVTYTFVQDRRGAEYLLVPTATSKALIRSSSIRKWDEQVGGVHLLREGADDLSRDVEEEDGADE